MFCLPIHYFIIFYSIGFSKLYKDKVKAQQEVDRIFLVLGNENNRIDYTGKILIKNVLWLFAYRIHHCFNEQGKIVVNK